MKRFPFRTSVFLSVCALLLAGILCPAYGQNQVPDDYKGVKEYKLGGDFVNPKMEIHGLNVANYTPEGARFIMSVKIINPNSKSANVKDMTYTLNVEGQALGRGNYAQDFKLPGRGTVALNLPLDVRFADLPKPDVALSLASKKNVQMEVDSYFIAAVGPIKRRVHVVYTSKDIEMKMLPPGSALPTIGPQGTEGGEAAAAPEPEPAPASTVSQPVRTQPVRTQPDSAATAPPPPPPPVRSMTGSGRAANIEQFQVNAGAKVQGQKGIQLKIRVLVDGMQGQECILAIFFYNSDGSKVITKVEEFSTPSGHATIQRRFTPASNSQSLEEVTAFIPAKVFGDPKGEMFAKLQVVTGENMVLDTSRQDFSLK